MAHKWAQWVPDALEWGTKSEVDTYRLPPKGSLTLQGGGRNQKGLTSGPGGYIAVRDTLHQGTKSERADKWAHWLHNPCRLGGP